MALQTFVDKIKAARAKYDEALKSLGAKQIAKALGEVIPEGFALSFAGGTPSFNDGDACTFSMYGCYLVTTKELTPESNQWDSPAPVLSDEDRSYIPHGGDEGCLDIDNSYNAADLKWCGLLKKDFDAVKAAWRLLSKDILVSAFGGDDGFHVVIRRGGKFEAETWDPGY
jgi:hypothetical protein